MRQGCIRLNPCWEMTVASAWLLVPKIHSWRWLSIGFGNVYIKLIIAYAKEKYSRLLLATNFLSVS